jgi:hypothetical protein
MKNQTKLTNFFKSQTKGNMKIAALGLTAVAIVIVALVASTLVLTPQNNESHGSLKGLMHNMKEQPRFY